MKEKADEDESTSIIASVQRNISFLNVKGTPSSSKRLVTGFDK
jgi:hypothetical protein